MSSSSLRSAPGAPARAATMRVLKRSAASRQLISEPPTQKRKIGREYHFGISKW
jgi:hypothetical protein